MLLKYPYTNNSPGTADKGTPLTDSCYSILIIIYKAHVYMALILIIIYF